MVKDKTESRRLGMKCCRSNMHRLARGSMAAERQGLMAGLRGFSYFRLGFSRRPFFASLYPCY